MFHLFGPQCRKKKFVILTLTAVIYIRHDPVFEEALSEDQGYVGAIVCPAEVDLLTYEEEGPYTVTGTVEVQDFKFVVNQRKLLEIKIVPTHSLQDLLK
jgi:hypothetical protein